jgi:hypothetical protein
MQHLHEAGLVGSLTLAGDLTIVAPKRFKEGYLTQFLATDPSNEVIIDDAWLRVLSRFPTSEERSAFLETLQATASEEKRAVVEDLYWSLLTSREFLFRH